MEIRFQFSNPINTSDFRAHSRDNEEAKRISAPKTNVIPSSDVSLHMNALAMKYISNHQKDENDFCK